MLSRIVPCTNYGASSLTSISPAICEALSPISFTDNWYFEEDWAESSHANGVRHSTHASHCMPDVPCIYLKHPQKHWNQPTSPTFCRFIIAIWFCINLCTTVVFQLSYTVKLLIAKISYPWLISPDCTVYFTKSASIVSSKAESIPFVSIVPLLSFHKLDFPGLWKYCASSNKELP